MQEQQRQLPEEIKKLIAEQATEFYVKHYTDGGFADGAILMYRKMQEELRQSDVDNQRNIETAIKIEKERDNAVAQITSLQEQVKEYRDGLASRINYLVEHERHAISELTPEKYPIGSPQRQVQWNFINELGHRKNELQDVLKIINKNNQP